MAMPAPNIADLTEQQVRELVAKRDKEIAALMNSDSSPQSMVDLQVLINKRNQAYEHLAELLCKQQQAIDGIIQNMR